MIYDFVEGACPWPAAPGIDETFGSRQLCYSYFDGSGESALKAVQALGDYVEEYGPFDCVLGFSLGAAIAATLLLRPDGDVARSRIRSVVFICATLPCDWDDLTRHHLRLIQAGEARESIRVPSVHSWSSEDPEYPGQSEQLFQMCKEDGRVKVLHSAGHSIPSRGSEAKAIAEAVKEMLARFQ